MKSQDIFRATPKTYRIVEETVQIPLDELRRKCITSTNVPKILDIDHRSCFKKILFSKLGNRFNKTNKDKLRGIKLEQIALQLFEKEINETVFPVYGYHRHPRYPFFVGSPDGVTAKGALIEVKAPRYRKWLIPAAHEAQMRFDQWVCDVELSYYVQIVGERIFYETVKRNDKMILDGLKKLCHFHQSLISIARVRGID